MFSRLQGKVLSLNLVIDGRAGIIGCRLRFNHPDKSRIITNEQALVRLINCCRSNLYIGAIVIDKILQLVAVEIQHQYGRWIRSSIGLIAEVQIVLERDQPGCRHARGKSASGCAHRS